MGSANSSIRSMAKDVFDTIIESCDKQTLFNPLITVTPGVNIRAKATFITTVAAMVTQAHRAKPAPVTKAIIQLLNKLLEDGKMDVRLATQKLVNVMYSVIGSSLLEVVPSAKLQQVMEILNSSHKI